MILSLFRKRSRVPTDVYGQAMTAARDPWLYADAGVPDTMDGRFEMLTLMLFLLMRRMKREPSLSELVQEVVDSAFKHLDHTLRETGVGDLSVPKKMKALAQRFYGRVAAYDAPFESGSADEVAAVLRRIVFPEEGPPGDPLALAHHALRIARHLDATPADDFLQGRVAFPAGPHGA